MLTRRGTPARDDCATQRPEVERALRLRRMRASSASVRVSMMRSAAFLALFSRVVGRRSEARGLDRVRPRASRETKRARRVSSAYNLEP